MHGPVAGPLRWQEMTIGQYAANPADEAQAVTETYLIDDDDPFLANGTPNCSSLTSAARRHSLPIPYLLPASPCGADFPPPSPEYRAPVLEAGLSGAAYDASPALSAAGLIAFFVSNRAGGPGATDIWTATRTSISAAWSAPTVVPNVNSPQNELAVAISDDALEMFLTSDRPGGTGGYDIYRSTRASPVSPWTAAVAVSGVNTASHDMDPSLTGDARELFFSSNRGGTFGIYSAQRLTTSTFGNVRVHRDAVGADEGGPAASSDGRKLMISTNQSGNYEVVQLLRTAPVYTFTTWRSITEVNSSTAELRGDETADGFSFYFSRIGNIGPSAAIWRADRILPKLNGPRTGTAGSTVAFFLRRDPGDIGSIVLGVDAIPPTPVPPVVGMLGILPLLTVRTAVHDANGLVGWATPPIPDAPGVVLQLQGISQDLGGIYYLSDRLSFLLLP